MITRRKISFFFLKIGLNIPLLLALFGLIGLIFFDFKTPAAKADFEAVLGQNSEINQLLVIQGNSLSATTNPILPRNNLIVTEQIQVIVTAYSSTIEETDNDPFITAAGSWVRDGIVANNLLPFGTKIRLPEIYGDKVFIVEDRMNSKKGDYQIDVWFSSREEAKNFGIRRTYIEILEG